MDKSKITRDKLGRIRTIAPAELAEKPVPVRFQRAIDAILRSDAVKDRSQYIRDAVAAKMRSEGLIE